jgi:hypothetical protein
LLNSKGDAERLDYINPDLWFALCKKLNLIVPVFIIEILKIEPAKILYFSDLNITYYYTLHKGLLDLT